jgi:hypothetical protein
VFKSWSPPHTLLVMLYDCTHKVKENMRSRGFDFINNRAAHITTQHNITTHITAQHTTHKNITHMHVLPIQARLVVTIQH